MEQVVVHPEKCVGCMQCMAACAIAHSRSKLVHTAVSETPLPRARVHVGVGLYGEGFPNRCRHCEPAPCMQACLSGAIFRDTDTATVMINPDTCINCASCAMACPYGVIRFHEDQIAPSGKTVAVKCDNCDERRAAGLIPACVEVCQSKRGKHRYRRVWPCWLPLKKRNWPLSMAETRRRDYGRNL
jgi:carbon-monoxide dehydrogenase iron sulfur subunit